MFVLRACIYVNDSYFRHGISPSNQTIGVARKWENHREFGYRSFDTELIQRSCKSKRKVHFSTGHEGPEESKV